MAWLLRVNSLSLSGIIESTLPLWSSTATSENAVLLAFSSGFTDFR